MTDLSQAIAAEIQKDEHLRALPPKADSLDAILRDMRACLDRFERFNREHRQRIDDLKRGVGGM